MDGDDRPGRRRQRRGGPRCGTGLRGPGRRRGSSGGEGRGLTGSPATRTFLAVATSAAQDLRDRDGIVRPLLRRGALRLTVSGRVAAQRLGAQYLRIDPPTPEEMARVAPPPEPRAVSPAAEGEADGLLIQGAADGLLIEGEAEELPAEAERNEPPAEAGGGGQAPY